jgi:ubiquinone/menaquinone biosynthesis C-methylase UbiE
MPKKRTPWTEQDWDYHDVEKYFELFDLSLRQYYTDLVEIILKPRAIEGRILDLGCGFGILGMRLCSHDEFSSAVGLDSSPVMVRTAEVITSRRGYNGRMTFKIWQDEKLPFADGEFDAVVSFMALHKWNSPEKVLAEIERVRKPGSRVYIRDFRRDQPAIPQQLFFQQVRFELGKEIAASLKKSSKSAYSAAEIKQILSAANLPDYRLEESKQFINIISGYPAESSPNARQEAETNTV